MSLDELFNNIGCNVKAEKEGKRSYIVLRVENGGDPNQFDIKSLFPKSIDSSRKYRPQPHGCEIIVSFSSPIVAEEAADTKIDGVTISIGRGKNVAGERQNKRRAVKKALDTSPEDTNRSKVHAWKMVKDIKILLRRHTKHLQEKKSTEAGNLQATAAIGREIIFLQKALQFLHTGALKHQDDYFDNYTDSEEVQLIKKTRVSLQSQVEKLIANMRKIVQESKRNPKKQLAMKKLKMSYYSSEMLLQYLRGERTPKIKKEVLELVEVKEEVFSDEEAADVPLKATVPAADGPKKGRAKIKRYFQLKN